jgi:hypothetical protein
MGAILFFTILVGICIWQFLHASIGLPFFLYLFFSLIGVLIIPFFLYRLYALWGAYYTSERDGLRLHWGLRVVDIPMVSIQWIYPADKVVQVTKHNIPLPPIWLPGAILGSRRWQADIRVEYLASDPKRLLFIATQDMVYGISPNDPEAFLYVHSRFIELGSIAPISARSIHPSFLITKVWNDHLARYLILSGFLLNLILLGWVSLIIPTRTDIVLGFLTDEPLPSPRFLLLPLVNSFFFMFGLIFGLFLYRRESSTTPMGNQPDSERMFSLFAPGRLLSILLWSFQVIATILFLFAVYFIQLPE